MRFGTEVTVRGFLHPDQCTYPSDVRVTKDTNSLRLGERSGVQVDVDSVAGDQWVNVVDARVTELLDQLIERRRRLVEHQPQNVGAVFVDHRRLERQVVLQEAQVALEHPVNVGRGAQPIAQAERLGEALAGWAPPMASLVAPIAVRHGRREPLQPGFVFPFLPTGRVAADYEVVRRVPDAHLPTALRLVHELDRWWLIVKLQSPRVMLVLVQRRQFDVMALRLDGDAHLSARVADRYIPRRASHPTRWR